MIQMLDVMWFVAAFCVWIFVYRSAAAVLATSHDLHEILEMYDDLPRQSPLKQPVLALHAMASQPWRLLFLMLRPRNLNDNLSHPRFQRALDEADTDTAEKFISGAEKALRIASRRSVVFKIIFMFMVLNHENRFSIRSRLTPTSTRILTRLDSLDA